MGGDIRRRQLPVDELAARMAQATSGQPQPVQLNLKILGPDFTVMAMFDMAIHFITGTLQVLNGLGKADAAKAFQSAMEHLIKSKEELFAAAIKEAEKAAPKVELASPEEVAKVIQP